MYCRSLLLDLKSSYSTATNGSKIATRDICIGFKGAIFARYVFGGTYVKYWVVNLYSS